MNKTVTIKNDIKLNENIEDFLNPDYIYIPLEENDSLAISTGKKILKEDSLLKNRKVFSPISGKYIGQTESMYIDNKTVRCMVLENDFKEKTDKKKGAVKYINEYTQEELIDYINKYAVCNREIDNSKKILIVNGIDSDPFEKAYSFIINNFCSKILETIDAISTILKIEHTYLSINNHDANNVINLSNHIGTYPNIKLKLLPDIYPIGYKEIVIQNTLNKKQINEGFIYLTVEDIYNIYNVLKRKKPILEKLITISGNSLEESKVVNIKIGTSMSDLIKNCCNVTNDKYFVIVNGLIAGSTLKSLNSPITNDIRSIFLNTKCEEKEKKCINCGLCNLKCPVGLNPKYIKEHKKADRSKCIGCGLCSYICPSKINFKPYLGGKNE